MDNNTSLFFLIYNLSKRYPFLDSIMIFGARYIIYLTFILMFVLAFKGGFKERKAVILALLSMPLVFLIIAVIHLFLMEPRPFITYHFSPLIPFIWKNDPAFPSRHASMMATITFSYTYFKSKWANLFLIFMIWVGISRIFVGVHYPLDILGGIFVGFISILISKQIIKSVKMKFFV